MRQLPDVRDDWPAGRVVDELKCWAADQGWQHIRIELPPLLAAQVSEADVHDAPVAPDLVIIAAGALANGGLAGFLAEVTFAAPAVLSPALADVYRRHRSEGRSVEMARAIAAALM